MDQRSELGVSSEGFSFVNIVYRKKFSSLEKASIIYFSMLFCMDYDLFENA